MEQYLRNLNSGVVHRVFVVNGKRFSNEQCNLDAALELLRWDAETTEGENCPHCFEGPPEADFEALGDAGESETDNG